LLPEQEKLCLDHDIPSKDLIHGLDEVPGEYFTWYRVSNRVNKVTENDAGLIEAV
jgi:putative SOS response-associated peptidase YedK